MRRSNLFSREMHLFILNNAQGITTKELTEKFNNRFNCKYTVEQIHAYKSRNKIKNGLTSGDSTRGKSFIYSQEIKTFILKNYAGITTQELTKKLNKKFNTTFKETQIRAYKKRLKLASGVVTQFQKGHISQNKGKKMTAAQYEKCKATMFKKGNVPHNHLPVGSEIVNFDGYVVVKIAEPNIWQFKQRLVYEKHYKTKIPTGLNVTFLDGNKRNFDIENLALVTNEENLFIMRNSLKSSDAAITKVGVNIAKLNTKIREKEQKNGNIERRKSK